MTDSPRPSHVLTARHDAVVTRHEHDKGPWPDQGTYAWWLRYWATNRVQLRRLSSMRSSYRSRMIARRRRG